MMHWGYSWGMSTGMLLMWGFWLAIIVLAIYAVINMTKNTADHKVSSNNALNILKERYARGEIDEAQFQKMKEQLK